MVKVYLSGPITGVENYRENFRKAEFELKELGYEVINPCNLEHEHNQSYAAFMKEDITALLTCDLIYMLPGWEKSKGAQLESLVATVCDIKPLHIVYKEAVCAR